MTDFWTTMWAVVAALVIVSVLPFVGLFLLAVLGALLNEVKGWWLE